MKVIPLLTLAGLAVLAVLTQLGWIGGDMAAGCALALAPAVLTDEQVREFGSLVGEIKESWGGLKTLPQEIETMKDDASQVKQQLKDLRRLFAMRQGPSCRRGAGQVSEECARFMAASFIQHCERSGKLEALCSASVQRDAATAFARDTLGLSTRAALNTTDIPLPVTYSGEIRELISEFGVVRKKMTAYPIGMGTARPARMGTRPAFGLVAMSQAFSEKSPTVTFASLESHKLGGIVRVPREIDEQSIVPMGQFLARYGAIEFARAEDTWGFLADGSGLFEGVKGVVKVAEDAGKMVQLAATKTKPSDATLEDFRAMRLKVDKAALNGRVSAYYLDSTWEVRLPAFKTTSEPNVYQRLPDGSATLDGYPIVWTDVMREYGTTAAPSENLCVFGALTYWWMGEHGSPRIDTSEHVWFANDQLAVRFIEEIDFDYMADDAMSVLRTAAA